jgi:hypothetical protein
MGMMNNVVPLFGYAVYEFPWGAAVKEKRTNKWILVCLKPDGQEIDVSNLKVILHDNGIEFIGGDLIESG